MRGFPKTIGCKQDLINTKDDFSKETLEKLQEILVDANQTVTRVVSGSEETNDLVLEIIPNPNPMWLRLGFNNLQEVQNMITSLGG